MTQPIPAQSRGSWKSVAIFLKNISAGRVKDFFDSLETRWREFVMGDGSFDEVDSEVRIDGPNCYMIIRAKSKGKIVWDVAKIAQWVGAEASRSTKYYSGKNQPRMSDLVM